MKRGSKSAALSDDTDSDALGIEEDEYGDEGFEDEEAPPMEMPSARRNRPTTATRRPEHVVPTPPQSSRQHHSQPAVQHRADFVNQTDGADEDVEEDIAESSAHPAAPSANVTVTSPDNDSPQDTYQDDFEDPAVPAAHPLVSDRLPIPQPASTIAGKCTAEDPVSRDFLRSPGQRSVSVSEATGSEYGENDYDGAEAFATLFDNHSSGAPLTTTFTCIAAPLLDSTTTTNQTSDGPSSGASFDRNRHVLPVGSVQLTPYQRKQAELAAKRRAIVRELRTAAERVDAALTGNPVVGESLPDVGPCRQLLVAVQDLVTSPLYSAAEAASILVASVSNVVPSVTSIAVRCSCLVGDSTLISSEDSEAALAVLRVASRYAREFVVLMIRDFEDPLAAALSMSSVSDPSESLHRHSGEVAAGEGLARERTELDWSWVEVWFSIGCRALCFNKTACIAFKELAPVLCSLILLSSSRGERQKSSFASSSSADSGSLEQCVDWESLLLESVHCIAKLCELDERNGGTEEHLLFWIAHTADVSTRMRSGVVFDALAPEVGSQAAGGKLKRLLVAPTSSGSATSVRIPTSEASKSIAVHFATSLCRGGLLPVLEWSEFRLRHGLFADLQTASAIVKSAVGALRNNLSIVASCTDTNSDDEACSRAATVAAVFVNLHRVLVGVLIVFSNTDATSRDLVCDIAGVIPEVEVLVAPEGALEDAVTSDGMLDLLDCCYSAALPPVCDFTQSISAVAFQGSGSSPPEPHTARAVCWVHGVSLVLTALTNYFNASYSLSHAMRLLACFRRAAETLTRASVCASKPAMVALRDLAVTVNSFLPSFSEEADAVVCELIGILHVVFSGCCACLKFVSLPPLTPLRRTSDATQNSRSFRDTLSQSHKRNSIMLPMASSIVVTPSQSDSPLSTRGGSEHARDAAGAISLQQFTVAPPPWLVGTTICGAALAVASIVSANLLLLYRRHAAALGMGAPLPFSAFALTDVEAPKDIALEKAPVQALVADGVELLSLLLLPTPLLQLELFEHPAGNEVMLSVTAHGASPLQEESPAELADRVVVNNVLLVTFLLSEEVFMDAMAQPAPTNGKATTWLQTTIVFLESLSERLRTSLVSLARGRRQSSGSEPAVSLQDGSLLCYRPILQEAVARFLEALVRAFQQRSTTQNQHECTDVRVDAERFPLTDVVDLLIAVCRLLEVSGCPPPNAASAADLSETLSAKQLLQCVVTMPALAMMNATLVAGICNHHMQANESDDCCGHMQRALCSLLGAALWTRLHECLIEATASTRDAAFEGLRLVSQSACRLYCCCMQRDLHAQRSELAFRTKTVTDFAAHFSQLWKSLEWQRLDIVLAQSVSYAAAVTELFETLFEVPVQGSVTALQQHSEMNLVVELYRLWERLALPWHLLEVAGSKRLLPALREFQADAEQLQAKKDAVVEDSVRDSSRSESISAAWALTAVSEAEQLGRLAVANEEGLERQLAQAQSQRIHDLRLAAVVSFVDDITAVASAAIYAERNARLSEAPAQLVQCENHMVISVGTDAPDLADADQGIVHRREENVLWQDAAYLALYCQLVEQETNERLTLVIGQVSTWHEGHSRFLREGAELLAAVTVSKALAQDAETRAAQVAAEAHQRDLQKTVATCEMQQQTTPFDLPLERCVSEDQHQVSKNLSAALAGATCDTTACDDDDIFTATMREAERASQPFDDVKDDEESAALKSAAARLVFAEVIAENHSCNSESRIGPHLIQEDCTLTRESMLIQQDNTEASDAHEDISCSMPSSLRPNFSSDDALPTTASLVLQFDSAWEELNITSSGRREPPLVRRCYDVLLRSQQRAVSADRATKLSAVAILATLREVKKKAAAVVRCIEAREATIERLHDFVVKYERTPQFFTAGLTDSILSTFLQEVRAASIKVVESTTAWRVVQREYHSEWADDLKNSFLANAEDSPACMRSGSWSADYLTSLPTEERFAASTISGSSARVSAPTVFLYRSMNYLDKMKYDLHFLSECALAKFLHIEVDKNVVLMAKKRVVDTTISESECRERNFFGRLAAPKGTLKISRAAGHLDPDEFGMKELHKAVDDEKVRNTWFRGVTAEEMTVTPTVSRAAARQTSRPPEFNMFKVLVPHSWRANLQSAMAASQPARPMSALAGPSGGTDIAGLASRAASTLGSAELRRPASAQLRKGNRGSPTFGGSSSEHATPQQTESLLDMFASLKKPQSPQHILEGDGPGHALKNRLKRIHRHVPSSADHATRLSRRHPLQRFATLDRSSINVHGPVAAGGAAVALRHVAIPSNASGMTVPAAQKARRGSMFDSARYANSSLLSVAAASSAAGTPIVVSVRADPLPQGLDGVFIICLCIFFYRKVRQRAKERVSASKIQRWFRRCRAQALCGKVIEDALAADSELMTWLLSLTARSQPLDEDDDTTLDSDTANKRHNAGYRSISKSVPRYANALQLFRVFTRAAITIQHQYRRYHQRCLIKALIGKMIGALKVQRWTRRQQQAQLLKAAAYVLRIGQKILWWIRNCKCRSEHRFQRRRCRNAIRIQRWFRIQVAKWKLKRLRFEWGRAVDIQRIFKGWLGRKRALYAQRVRVIGLFIKAKMWHRELAQQLLYKEVARRVRSALDRTQSMRTLLALREAKAQRLRIYLRIDQQSVERRAASRILAHYRGWKTRSQITAALQVKEQKRLALAESMPDDAVCSTLLSNSSSAQRFVGLSVSNLRPSLTTLAVGLRSATWHLAERLVREYAPVVTTLQCFFRKCIAKSRLLQLKTDKRMRGVHFAAWLVARRRLQEYHKVLGRRGADGFFKMLLRSRERAAAERRRQEEEHCARMLLHNNKATRIQSVWRRHITMSAYCEAREEHRKWQAEQHERERVLNGIVGIQRQARVFLRLQHWRRVFHNRHHRAACIIQRAWRSLWQRQAALILQLEAFKQRSLAAFKIQAWFRACLLARLDSMDDAEEWE